MNKKHCHTTMEIKVFVTKRGYKMYEKRKILKKTKHICKINLDDSRVYSQKQTLLCLSHAQSHRVNISCSDTLTLFCTSEVDMTRLYSVQYLRTCRLHWSVL